MRGRAPIGGPRSPAANSEPLLRRPRILHAPEVAGRAFGSQNCPCGCPFNLPPPNKRKTQPKNKNREGSQKKHPHTQGPRRISPPPSPAAAGTAPPLPAPASPPAPGAKGSAKVARGVSGFQACREHLLFNEKICILYPLERCFF